MTDLHSPWQIAQIPIGKFPIAIDQLDTVRAYFRAFAEVVAQTGSRHSQVFLQTWKLDAQTSGAVLNAHMKQWRPEMGLGVWPDRKPPQGWTETSFVDAAAAKFRGDEPELNVHRLIRLTALDIEPEVAEQLRGSGTLVETFSCYKPQPLLEISRRHALKRISEQQYRDEKFYLPLLDMRSIAASRTPEQLGQWLDGIDVYVRESAEDQSILILSRLPLALLFEQAQQLLQERTARLQKAYPRRNFEW